MLNGFGIKIKLMVMLLPFLLLSVSGFLFGMDANHNDELLKAFTDKKINSIILSYLDQGADFDSLINAGIDINTVDASKGDTLLHIIVANGKINIFNNFLGYFSPNPNIRNNNGSKAICLARSIIDSSEEKAKELERNIQSSREEHQKYINGIETFTQKKDPRDTVLTLFGSAFVGAGSWWCYKYMHHLKKWGLF